MSHILVVVESPTKSKTIKRYLDGWQQGRFQVTSSVGHIIDLPEKELGVDLENDFEPTYVPASRKDKVISELKKLAKGAESVLLATDQDREGEAIAWHIERLLKAGRRVPPISRIRFNEITKQAIIEAVSHPELIDTNRVDAQQARRVMDRLVGYQVSPLLWKTVSRGLSAGRVQSVAVRLICEREEEINAFVPQEYWTFTGLFRDLAAEDFHADLHKVWPDAATAKLEAGKKTAGEKPAVSSEAEAMAWKREMLAADWSVQAIQEKQVSRKAPAPFITSTMQQDAARRLGFSPKKSMMLAQQLYEGVELANGEVAGLITYMRTDSTRLADSALEEARGYLEKRFGKDSIPAKPNVFKSKGKAQDAHEAIRPTTTRWSPADLKDSLSRDQLRLYTLIWNRFLASQMVPALYQQRSVDLLGDRFLFRCTGSVLSRKGFLELYEDVKEKKKKSEESSSKRPDLPVPVKLKEGEAVTLEEMGADQHFTKPPARFSQESLIKALEELGIGRPSTYASIVDMILKRSYVELKEKRFHPSDLGQTVNRILVTHFADIFNVDFTARMEAELDSIESGRDWKSVMHDFYGPFSAALKEADAKRGEIRASTTEKLGEACPECGGELIYKWGRNGRFIACNNFPDCRYTRDPNEGSGEEAEGELCDECGAPMLVRNSRFGRFLGCSRYPECKGKRPIDLGVACPQEGCDGKLAERKGRRGVFYGCTRYPKCTFATWDKPTKTACPACGHAWMGLKQRKQGDDKLICPVCKYEHDPAEAEMQ
jgi:DNA topoisomerase-1